MWLWTSLSFKHLIGCRLEDHDMNEASLQLSQGYWPSEFLCPKNSICKKWWVACNILQWHKSNWDSFLYKKHVTGWTWLIMHKNLPRHSIELNKWLNLKPTKSLQVFVPRKMCFYKNANSCNCQRCHLLLHVMSVIAHFALPKWSNIVDLGQLPK